MDIINLPKWWCRVSNNKLIYCFRSVFLDLGTLCKISTKRGCLNLYHSYYIQSNDSITSSVVLRLIFMSFLHFLLQLYLCNVCICNSRHFYNKTRFCVSGLSKTTKTYLWFLSRLFAKMLLIFRGLEVNLWKLSTTTTIHTTVFC